MLHNTPVSDRVKLLTPKQRRVLDHVLDGKRNREIAEEMHVELETVKWHLGNIYRILGLTRRFELFRELGLGKLAS